ncbi:hypothetical protein ALP29_03631 [Pseudomonas syringae pv. avii]|uniref:Uncharacterized protein n=1 Tax=Pseudomonas syringae pv. avii TaxID=663959 RepID=A0A3M5W9M2_PSESX|nr:hypothetical protein [Pseudomonas azotoformans]RMT70260.1 hypothetical protein ALP43_04259 [Pseudomonas azotoformans]RMU67270.1 hypothetical protein ALP29_03631 [Pseudomonas syringae pv. avii]
MIDIDQVRKLNVQNGDLLVVPENTEQEDMQQFLEALRYLVPNADVTIVRGPMELLDVDAMNKLGWHRK